MIVIDASIVVELLTSSGAADSIKHDMMRQTNSFIAPHLLDVEVMSAFRSLAAVHRLDPHRTKQFISALSALPVTRYAHGPLFNRIWELRRNFTSYDAAYIALAEVTGSVLYTTDRKLSEGHKARVVLFTNRFLQ